MNEALLSPHLHKGKLLRYGDGGYPLYYITEHSECLCADCATERLDEITGVAANWEDVSMYCADCSERIETAYAEDAVELSDFLREAEVEDVDPEWFVGWDNHSEVGTLGANGRQCCGVIGSGGVIIELTRSAMTSEPHGGLATLPRWDADRRLNRRRAFISFSRYDAMPEDVEAATLELANDYWGGGWSILTVIDVPKPEKKED